MTPERWNQIDNLLQGVLERPFAERATLLAEACAGDEFLRQEVESLISFREMAESFLEVPALEAAADLLCDGQAESMEGLVIGRYRIEALIGRGGMGEVYLAEDTNLDIKVAIKFLPSYLEKDELAKKRLIREAKAAAQLDHPNICSIYEVAEKAGHSFIVMQYVVGETLASRIQRPPLAVGESLEVALQVADALVQAHSRGIIHRDIKPQNIMITQRGQVKVLDFGLAKLDAPGDGAAEAPTRSLLSAPGVIIGTAPYMSPEQAKGSFVDARSDLFSLGVVLYECVTGRLPFAGDTPMETRGQVIHVHPPPPSQFNPHVSPELDAVTLKALAKEADARYQSAADLLEDLRAVRSTLQPDDRAPTKQLPVKTAKPRPSALTSLSEALRRPRVLIPTIAVALTLALPAFWIVLPRLRTRPHLPSREAMFWYDAGTTALRNGAYYQASKALQQAVKIDDKFALGHAWLAEAYTELDYSDKAKDEIIRAESLARQLPMQQSDALYLQAVTNTVLRDFPPAIESYKQIARQASDNEKANVYLDLGRAYEKNDQLKEAKENYQEAAKFAPQEAAAFLRLGVVCGQLQDSTCASEAFQKAEALYEALGNHEGVTEVFYQRAFLFIYEVKLLEAGAQLDKALQMTKATGNQYQLIRVLQLLSTVSALEGHIAQATKQATEAVQLARDNGIENQATSGLIFLGGAFLWRGDYSNAERYYQQALELAQRDKLLVNEAWALTQLGSLRSKQHKTEEALHYIERAIVFYQQRGYRKWLSLTLPILGRSYRDRGDYEAALKTFEEQLKLGEQLGDQFEVGLVDIDIGNVLSYKEQYPEALGRFDESYRIFKSLKAEVYMAYAAENRASVLWRLGRSEEGRAALNEAASFAERAEHPEDTYKQLLADIHLTNSLLELSDWHLRESKTKALKLADSEYPAVAIQAKHTLALAQARAGVTRGTKLLCQEAIDMAAGTADPQLLSGALLASAEALLYSGEAQPALEAALRAQESFARYGKSDSEWRAWLIAAQASQRLGNQTAAHEYSSYAVARLSDLEQKWGSKAYNGYLARADIMQFRKQLDQLLKA